MYSRVSCLYLPSDISICAKRSEESLRVSSLRIYRFHTSISSELTLVFLKKNFVFLLPVLKVISYYKFGLFCENVQNVPSLLHVATCDAFH